MNAKELLDPITPGEILREDFMEPMGLSINRLARDLVVPPNRISGIVNGKRAITADTALRLQRYFKIEAQFWLNLQTEHDLRMVKRKIWSDIERRILPVQDMQAELCSVSSEIMQDTEISVTMTASFEKFRDCRCISLEPLNPWLLGPLGSLHLFWR